MEADLIYQHPIWDPIELVGRFRNPAVAAVSMFTAVVATLAVNIAANVVSPANDFANAFPRLIGFRKREHGATTPEERASVGAFTNETTSTTMRTHRETS